MSSRYVSSPGATSSASIDTAGAVGEPACAARGATPLSLGDVAAVAIGGAIGALLRVSLATAFPTPAGRFPWTTFAENVFGAFLLGWLLVLLLGRVRPARWVQPFLCTGVLGSFTTFSTFSVEWVALGSGEQPWLAAVYPLASMSAGLVAAGVGMGLARRWPAMRRAEAELEGRR